MASPSGSTTTPGTRSSTADGARDSQVVLGEFAELVRHAMGADEGRPVTDGILAEPAPDGVHGEVDRPTGRPGRRTGAAGVVRGERQLGLKRLERYEVGRGDRQKSDLHALALL